MTAIRAQNKTLAGVPASTGVSVGRRVARTRVQVARCYNCGADRSSFYASENGFTLVKCRGCGLLFVNPRPCDEDILVAHRCGLHRGCLVMNTTGAFDPKKIWRNQEVLRDLFGETSALQGRSWLDIGCGHGEFLIALQEFGAGNVAAKGYEPNIHKQKSAQRRGLDVGYFDLNEQVGRFDFISSLNVYSHLPDPPETIGQWKCLLKPGGGLLLETGDTADFASRDHPRPFGLPDHLSFASEQIVREILKRTGFEIVCIRKYPGLEPRPVRVVWEFAKIFLPHRTSMLRHLVRYRRYAHVDMFILARLVS